MYDEMNGLYSMNGGMPPGVSRPRRRPAMWCDGSSSSAFIVAETPQPGGDFAIDAEVFLGDDGGVLQGLVGPNQTVSTGDRSGVSLIYRKTVSQIRVSVATSATAASDVCYIPISNDKQWYSIHYTYEIATYTHTLTVGAIRASAIVPIFWRADGDGSCVIDRWASSYPIYWMQGCPRNVRYSQNGALLAHWKGDGITNDNWRDLSGNGYHGTVSGSPERCLVHVRGAVIRTDPGTGERYIVR